MEYYWTIGYGLWFKLVACGERQVGAGVEEEIICLNSLANV